LYSHCLLVRTLLYKHQWFDPSRKPWSNSNRKIFALSKALNVEGFSDFQSLPHTIFYSHTSTNQRSVYTLSRVKIFMMSSSLSTEFDHLFEEPPPNTTSYNNIMVKRIILSFAKNTNHCRISILDTIFHLNANDRCSCSFLQDQYNQFKTMDMKHHTQNCTFSRSQPLFLLMHLQNTQRACVLNQQPRIHGKQRLEARPGQPLHSSRPLDTNEVLSMAAVISDQPDLNQ
jgi:hypothetical protein